MKKPKSKFSLLNVFIALTSVFIAIAITFVFLWIREINTSLEAENRSWATASTCLIIEQYIIQNDPPQWPRSWDDLADIVRTEQWSDWPDEREFYEQNVAINFSATLEEIAQMTPENFSAVKPIGGHYWHAEMHYQTLIEAAQSVVDSE